MHRHGYQGRKFHRQQGQRKALISGLADSLILHESITTTVPKAKEVIPFVEKLITKAKKSDLHNRRLIISALGSVEASNKLVDEISPKLKARNSGYLRLEKTGNRRGDHADMAKISFVDDLKEPPVAKPAEKNTKLEAAEKPVTKGEKKDKK